MTSYQRLSLALWLATLVAVVWVVGLFRASRSARRPAARRRAHELRIEAQGHLDHLAPVADLALAWTRLLPRTGAFTTWPNDLRLVTLLCDGETDAVDALRQLARRYIEGLNSFAEMLDYGLTRPKDYFLRYTQDHERVFMLSSLLAPVVWYESVVRGKGRYGYRVLQLRDVTVALRPMSRDQRVIGRLTLAFEPTACQLLPAVGKHQRLLSHIRSTFKSPAITVASKVQQNEMAAQLRTQLVAAGFTVVNLSDRGKHPW